MSELFNGLIYLPNYKTILPLIVLLFVYISYFRLHRILCVICFLLRSRDTLCLELSHWHLHFNSNISTAMTLHYFNVNYIHNTYTTMHTNGVLAFTLSLEYALMAYMLNI